MSTERYGGHITSPKGVRAPWAFWKGKRGGGRRKEGGHFAVAPPFVAQRGAHSGNIGNKSGGGEGKGIEATNQ